MRTVLVLLLLLLSFTIRAQRPWKPMKMRHNMIGAESGMFHRGLIGASYHRLLAQRDHFIAATGAGLGIGGIPSGGGVNQFYYATIFAGPGFTLEGERLYVVLGADLKYVDYHDSEDNHLPYWSLTYFHHRGFGCAPYFGITVPSGPLFFQMRGSFDVWIFRQDIPRELTGVGLTVGRIF